MAPDIFIPLRSNEPSTLDYLGAKIKTYEVCIENECFDDAYVNAHLVFIYWLYCKLWTVVNYKPKLVDQIFALHSFDSKYDRDKFLCATSALELCGLKLEERKYAEVFGALCLDRDEVKILKNFVDVRNDILHPSGLIKFNSQEELNDLLEYQIKIAAKIAQFMAPIYIELVKGTYGKISNYKMKKWETDYNLEQNLFTKYHLSNIDLIAIKGFCAINDKRILPSR